MAVSNCAQLPVGHVGPSRTRWNALAVLMAGAPTCAQLPAEGDTGLGGLHHESGHVLQMLLALLASAGRAALGLMPCLQASGRACNSKTSQHTGRRWLLPASEQALSTLGWQQPAKPLWASCHVYMHRQVRQACNLAEHRWPGNQQIKYLKRAITGLYHRKQDFFTDKVC